MFSDLRKDIANGYYISTIQLMGDCIETMVFDSNHKELYCKRGVFKDLQSQHVSAILLAKKKKKHGGVTEPNQLYQTVWTDEELEKLEKVWAKL